MKFSVFTCVTAATAAYVCPAHLGSDNAPIAFAYKIQKLLAQYYGSVPANASFFQGLPGADEEAMNGQTLAENTAINVMGLGKQAMLAIDALENAMYSDTDMDPCDYMYPTAPNGSAHLQNAFYLEATLCGAFIGLADYTTSPEASFLMARIAAEHGIHASAIRAMMQPVGFMPNSSSLTPAFTPDTVVQMGDDMEVGMLGKWLNGCAMPPDAPCGGTVEIGMLGSNLTQQSGPGCEMQMPSTSTSMIASATEPVQVPTGAASAKGGSVGFVIAGMAAALM